MIPIIELSLSEIDEVMIPSSHFLNNPNHSWAKALGKSKMKRKPFFKLPYLALFMYPEEA
jgi:hypothetical protein